MLCTFMETNPVILNSGICGIYIKFFLDWLCFDEVGSLILGLIQYGVV